jgi:nucleoside-diphosphate-sugar epimerase
MENVLITGGAGYIGNVLTNHLLSLGDVYPSWKRNITILDNLNHRNGTILEHCFRENFNFVYGDVRDESLYKSLISKNDVIINLAAYVGMPLCKRYPIETKQVNQESAELLAKNISKDQLVIYTTTNSGYGTGTHTDGKATYCTEETPLNPISLYGETKCAAEKALMDTQRGISLRLATVFGTSKKMRLDLLVNEFVWRAWNDRFIVLFESGFMRNFIHIQDVANTIEFSMRNRDLMVGEVYNVGNTNININKMDLCLKIKKYVNDFFITESEFNKDPDKRNYIVSNQKLESLGWSCKYDLDFGIMELLKACPIIKYSNTPLLYL